MIRKLVSLLVVTLCMLIGVSAWATQGNNGNGNGGCGQGQQTNGCGGAGGAGGNGYGGQGGAGIGVGVGVSSSTAEARSNSNSASVSGAHASGGDASATGGAGGNVTSSNAASGYGGTASGNGSGNAVTIQGSTNTYREAAQTAYAPTQQQPRTSCRIFVGLGGSSREGSLSGGIPIGNDQSCLSGLQVELMDKVNTIKAGTFTAADYLSAVCLVEGMERMTACVKK